MRILSAVIIVVFISCSSGASSEEAVLPAAPELKCFQSEEQAEAAETNHDIFVGVGEIFRILDEESMTISVEQWCTADLSAGEKIRWHDREKGIVFVLGYRRSGKESFLDITADKGGKRRSMSLKISELDAQGEEKTYEISERAKAKLLFENGPGEPNLFVFFLELQKEYQLYPEEDDLLSVIGWQSI